ncbi:MAG: cell division protein FtsA [Candidatus Nomurabacteria bacterium]|jgi:cell division protein FtsA|nr:cell division protein FtsA [Candidatus Nomurabacteria bacterium]
MQGENHYGVGIDIGTNSVRVAIGMAEGKNRPIIVGFSEVKNSGMRKGTIISIDQTAAALDKALSGAEKMASYHIVSATVSINGAHIVGQTSHGAIAVTGREVMPEDVRRVEQDASLIQLGDNREILDITTRGFILGGQTNIKDPIGMSGLRLEVDSYIISGLTPHINNLEKVFDLVELPKTTILPSGLAAAQTTLSRNQKENGVVCVDIGGTTTNIIIYDEGELYHTAILPVGGNNVTNDLAIGLRTDLEIAEKVKVDYAVAAASQRRKSGRIKIMADGRDHYFETALVDQIVEARMEEIFELVNLELRRVDRYAKLPGGVVLTGGGAELTGIAECAKEVMKLNAKVSEMHKFGGLGDKVSGPAWSTALGLMIVDIKDDIAVMKPKKAKKWFFKKSGK